MTNIVEFKTEVKELSVLERINQQHEIYLCIDCEQYPCFASPSYAQACRYARQHFCTISVYPKGTYTEPKY